MGPRSRRPWRSRPRSPSPASSAYLRGEDLTLNEPALGVSPLRGDLGLRWEPSQDGRFLEFTGAPWPARTGSPPPGASRRPPGTPPWISRAVCPFRVGSSSGRGDNLLDAEVVNHLNARNPFTGITVPEPGRVLFARLSVRF
jgi:iron complex outermembrane recepter protein